MKRLLITSGLSVLTACSFATTLYSTGFESGEGYTDGDQLSSISDWTVYDGSATSFAVTNALAQGGLQAATYDTAPATSYGWALVNLTYDPSTTTEKILEGSVSIFITNESAGNSQFGLAAYGGSSFLGGLYTTDNAIELDDQVGVTAGGTINYGEWNTFTLRLNYANNTMDGLINGSVVASATFDGTTATDFDLFEGPYGYNKAYFDNYNVKSTSPVPEPMTMTALGIGALGLLRKKRRP